MSTDNAVAPIIIKRKKVVGGDGHHGGAWKVAYADFVTAMMAFFLLMWLLNATTEKQRKGIADYFSPTIALARVSGGGDGALNGNSVFAEAELPRVGTGATSLRPVQDFESSGAHKDADDPDAEAQQESFERVEELLMGRSGESDVADDLLEHIVTRVTDEGLVVELYETENAPLFTDSGEPTALMRRLSRLVVQASVIVTNPVAVEGHTHAYPVVLAKDPSWDVSGARATAFRELLIEGGFSKNRVNRVTAHADREPTRENRMDKRNSRIELVFLRE